MSNYTRVSLLFCPMKYLKRSNSISRKVLIYNTKAKLRRMSYLSIITYLDIKSIISSKIMSDLLPCTFVENNQPQP